MTHPAVTHRPRAYSAHDRVRVILVAGVFPALVAISGALLMLSWAPQLPDPVAIHWNGSGQADGYGSLAAIIAIMLGCALVFSAAVTFGLTRLKAAPQGTHQVRALSATSVTLAVFLTIGMTGSIAVQRGVANAADSVSINPVMLAGVAIGIAFGALAWFLTPLPAVDPNTDGADTGAVLTLSPEERASWRRSARPATRTVVLFFLVLGGVLLGSVVVMALTIDPSLWWTVAILVGVLIASAVCFYWNVSVDHRGFMVRSGAGFPRISIPLDEISRARVVQVSPLADFGGWGWRWTAGTTGIVVRAGEAVEVTRTSGKALVVTVDDAATAVALLEGLRGRRGLSVPPADA